jgi:nucleoside-diphosphate-sugar epimerase
MKVLVVGGSGLIGGEAAIYLREMGHDVTIMARNRPAAAALSEFSFLQGDYSNDDFSTGQLEGFDWLVFAAAADIRSVPFDGSVTPEEFYTKTNDEAVPHFLEAARNSGISRVVYIGTFYPQVAPDRIGICPYVTSRHNTDLKVRALNTDTFNVCCLNAPFVIGSIDGLEIPHVSALVQYAKGNLVDLPIFSPAGGTSHISSRSLAQATLNALEKGEPGKAYLVGDENYSWKDYLELWFSCAGNPTDLEVRTDDHPMLPDVIMFAGPGATVTVTPPDEDMAVLAYDRGQIKAAIESIVN